MSQSDWQSLPVGAWFFIDVSKEPCSFMVEHHFTVAERTLNGWTLVCSTPFTHEKAKQQMHEIAMLHNAFMAIKVLVSF